MFRRGTTALVIAVAAHAAFVMLMLEVPTRLHPGQNPVDMDVWQSTKPTSEVQPPAPQVKDEPPPPPPPRLVVKRSDPVVETVEPAPPSPVDPPTPEEKEDPPVPSVYDIADNSTALSPSDGGTMAPSEGNTALAPVASPGQTSVRGTAPASATSPSVENRPNGGFAPIPRKDWTRRPEPRNGMAPPPPYPVEARRKGVEGKVRLQVSVGKDGRVKDVVILSDPGEGLGPAAAAAMRKLQWLPALGPGGTPADTIVIYIYNFVLN